MRLIDADALNIDREHFDTYADYSHAFDMIDNAPTIDAVPVRHGKWGKVKHYDNVFSCSYCGELTTETVMGKPRYEYCPMCGARMVENG